MTPSHSTVTSSPHSTAARRASLIVAACGRVSSPTNARTLPGIPAVSRSSSVQLAMLPRRNIRIFTCAFRNRINKTCFGKERRIHRRETRCGDACPPSISPPGFAAHKKKAPRGTRGAFQFYVQRSALQPRPFSSLEIGVLRDDEFGPLRLLQMTLEAVLHRTRRARAPTGCFDPRASARNMNQMATEKEWSADSSPRVRGT